MGLYFVRHGQTDWNVLRKLQGQTDIELNNHGIDEAKITKEKFKNIKIDYIYCSPLKRAIQTAEIINELWDLEIYKEPNLIERSFGDLEGTDVSTIDFNDIWKFNPDKNYPNLEDARSFYRRVDKFVFSILKLACEANILIVAHGGVGIPVKALFENYCGDQNMTRFIIKNCEVLYFDETMIKKLLNQNKPLV